MRVDARVPYSAERSSGDRGVRPALPRDGRRLLLLTTGTAADVLVRLMDGDPLGLRTRLRRRAAERFLLVSPEGLFARAAAHCARRAESYRGRPAPGPWLERELDCVLDAWVSNARSADDEHAGGAFSGGTFDEPTQTEPTHVQAARDQAPGVEPGDRERVDLEKSAQRFNACSRAERATLWRLAFAGASLDELAHESRSDLGRTARRAHRALVALLGRVELGRVEVAR